MGFSNKTVIWYFYVCHFSKMLETIIGWKKNVHCKFWCCYNVLALIVQISLNSPIHSRELAAGDLPFCPVNALSLWAGKNISVIVEFTPSGFQCLLHWSYLYRDQSLLVVTVVLTTTGHSVLTFSSPQYNILTMKSKFSSLSRTTWNDIATWDKYLKSKETFYG